MTETSNDWCRVLGIDVPELAALATHRDANSYALLLVALLERGEPMTLEDVAERFERAGIASAAQALASLKRCRPARAPVYREGDRYHLDPYDRLLDLWVLRLELRPPRVPLRRLPEPEPLAGADVPLTEAELDEAWHDQNLYTWPVTRLALAVLDAAAAPLPPEDVVAAVARRARFHLLGPEPAKFRSQGSPVSVLSDGRWAIGARADLSKVRDAVRARIALLRKQRRGFEPDPEAKQALEHERAERRAELARMSHALLVAFPKASPRAVTLLDVGSHTLATFVGDELSDLPARLAAFDIIGAVDVRALLRALGIEHRGRRLAELGPPQKSLRLNRRGRTLAITTALLVQGSCGIGRPFGDPKKLAEYLARGELEKLRRRLEADAKSLHALYEYGRLHGCVRLRWGYLDQRIRVPWVDSDEPTLYDLKRRALELEVPLEVVVGSAPGWEDPWSRVRKARVIRGTTQWSTFLADEFNIVIPEDEVQRARLP